MYTCIQSGGSRYCCSLTYHTLRTCTWYYLLAQKARFALGKGSKTLLLTNSAFIHYLFDTEETSTKMLRLVRGNARAVLRASLCRVVWRTSRVPVPMPVPVVRMVRPYSENLGGKSMTNGTQIPQEILDLPLQKYHEESDIFLEELYDELEELSEMYAKNIPELEYSQGVLTLTLDGVGTYVINKQPPNKQIWFASPESGPNRFDLYKGQWISLRDNKNLLEVLNKELHDALPKDAEFNIVKK